MLSKISQCITIEQLARLANCFVVQNNDFIKTFHLLTGQAYIIVWRNPLIEIYLSCPRACLYACTF